MRTVCESKLVDHRLLVLKLLVNKMEYVLEHVPCQCMFGWQIVVQVSRGLNHVKADCCSRQPQNILRQELLPMGTSHLSPPFHRCWQGIELLALQKLRARRLRRGENDGLGQSFVNIEYKQQKRIRSKLQGKPSAQHRTVEVDKLLEPHRLFIHGCRVTSSQMT